MLTTTLFNMQGLVFKPWWTKRVHLKKTPKKWASSYMHSVRFWNTMFRTYKQSLKLFSPGWSESKTIDDITLVVHGRFMEPTKINSFPLSGPAGSPVCQWAVTIAVQGWAWPVNCCWQEENMLTAREQVRTQICTSVCHPERLRARPFSRHRAYSVGGLGRVCMWGGGGTPVFIAQVSKGLSWLQPTISCRDYSVVNALSVSGHAPARTVPKIIFYPTWCPEEQEERTPPLLSPPQM